MTKNVRKAVEELKKPCYVFLGSIADVLEQNKIYLKYQIRQVFKGCSEFLCLSNKDKHFIYEQMETRFKRNSDAQ